MKPRTVYGLYDLDIKELVYVGISSRPKNRLCHHRYKNPRREGYGGYFAGRNVNLLILEAATTDPEREYNWIQFFEAKGIKLENKAKRRGAKTRIPSTDLPALTPEAKERVRQESRAIRASRAYAVR